MQGRVYFSQKKLSRTSCIIMYISFTFPEHVETQSYNVFFETQFCQHVVASFSVAMLLANRAYLYNISSFSSSPCFFSGARSAGEMSIFPELEHVTLNKAGCMWPKRPYSLPQFEYSRKVYGRPSPIFAPLMTISRGPVDTFL